MNLNMLLKLGNLICAHVDYIKFTDKTLDYILQSAKQQQQQNNNNNNNNNNNLLFLV